MLEFIQREYMSYIDEFYDSINYLINASSSENLHEILVTQAIDIVGADNGALYIAERGGRFCRKFSTLNKKTVPRKRGYTSEVFEKNEPKILTEKQVSVIHPEQIDAGHKSFIILPIGYQNRKSGVLHFKSRKDNHFKYEHIEALNSYCRNAFFLMRNLDRFDRLHKAIKNRDMFLSLAAHEIKTPLSVVKLYGDMMNRKIEKKQIPDIQLIHLLNQGVDRLVNVVNEYLGMKESLITKVRCFKRKVDLCGVIDRSMLEVMLVYPSHKFLFKNNIGRQPINVNIDDEKITQVFVNVLNNAAKYSKQRTTVNVELKQTNNYLITTINDKGSGIGKKDLSKIFIRFYRGRNIKEKEGMGLGLYIAKNIMKAHNGDIRITSSVGKGTQVAILLPHDKN